MKQFYICSNLKTGFRPYGIEHKYKKQDTNKTLILSHQNILLAFLISFFPSSKAIKLFNGH